MPKLFLSILSADRKHRRFAVVTAIRLLRAVRDVEQEEANRYSDMLDDFDLDSESIPKCRYAAIEDDYLNCEHSFGVLESAIEDLLFAYEGRF